MKQIEVTIASYQDRPGLVAEFWCEDGMWGELRLDEATKLPQLELFPLPAGRRAVFHLEAVEKALQGAKRRLHEIEGLTTKSP